jgi:hypothetical protein
MLNTFKLNKFTCEEFTSKSWDNLPLPQKKMAVEFQSFSESDLRVKEFNVMLRPVKQQ